METNKELMRAEFEKSRPPKTDLTRRGEKYKNPVVQQCWEAWQAALSQRSEAKPLGYVSAHEIRQLQDPRNSRMIAVCAEPIPPDVTVAIYTAPALSAQRSEAVDGEQKPFHHYGLSMEQIEQLRSNGLKPEEISGADDVQHDRVGELLWWFSRLTQGNANPKWAVRHAFELAYFVATNGINHRVDLKAVRDAAFKEGVNVTPSERRALEICGIAHPAPAPSAATGEQVQAWDTYATQRLRSIVDLLGLQPYVPHDGLAGYEFAVLGFVRREIERLKAAAKPTPAQGDAVPVATKCAACNGEGWVRDIHDMEQGRIRCTKCATRQSSADAVDALSMKLPCDVTIGGVTIRAGCKLSTLITRFTSIHSMAMEYAPKADPAFVEKIRKIVSGEHEQ